MSYLKIKFIIIIIDGLVSTFINHAKPTENIELKISIEIVYIVDLSYAYIYSEILGRF